MISVVIVDSRSTLHPDWMQCAINSVKSQSVEVELIIVDNTKKGMTIGKAFNEGVKRSKGEWVLFVGDDDYISADYCNTLLTHADYFKRSQIEVSGITTYMTLFDEKKHGFQQKNPTGMIKRKYLLENPFNENLEKGIDRELIENMVSTGHQYIVIPYHFGYFYRQHKEEVTVAATIGRKPEDIYIVARYKSFIDDFISDMKNSGYSIEVSEKFEPELASNAKIIWCDWGDINSMHIANYETDAVKILRIHAYEAFDNNLNYVDLNKFDKVIFVANHIKDYLERRRGFKIKNSMVIPNGANLNKFKIPEGKKRNNKICYAGQITRKKGGNELLLLAKELPEYEFHIAGKFNENDLSYLYDMKAPSNLFLHPYQYNLNEFFKDKTYNINVSAREGCPVTTIEAMASGLRPLVYDWVGATDIFGKEYVWSTIADLKRHLNSDYNPYVYRTFVSRRYNYNGWYRKMKAIVDNYLKERNVVHK